MRCENFYANRLNAPLGLADGESGLLVTVLVVISMYRLQGAVKRHPLMGTVEEIPIHHRGDEEFAEIFPRGGDGDIEAFGGQRS